MTQTIAFLRGDIIDRKALLLNVADPSVDFVSTLKQASPERILLVLEGEILKKISFARESQCLSG